MFENEMEIHDLIVNNEDYDEILKNDNRWDILYNLSPLRENLLEWYMFDKSATLLEVDGEFGALTSFYCKKVSSVVSLCDNDLQQESIEYRCRMFSNLKVVQNIHEIHDKYDYITIINPKTDVHVLVSKILEHLKTDGQMIIACDNSLSLKYFIEDEKAKSSTSVSRNDIIKFMKQNGFKNIEFYYPSPDFRLPNTIYSENYLPHEGDIRNVNQCFDSGKYQVLNEDYIYDAACNENLYENIANSFLIFASR